MTDGTAMTSAEMFGTAKKINNDLETLPLHTHGAVLSMLNNAFQHRQVSMQREETLRQQGLQERQVALAEEQMAIARERQEKVDAEAMLTVVKQ